MYFNNFNEYTRKIWREDKAKHDVITEIIYNANYQEEYNGLKNRECYFSYKVIEDRCNITHKKALRIMKELEAEGFIKWVYKSNSKGKKSIILLCENEPKKEPVEEPVEEPVKVSNDKALRGAKEPVEEPVKGPSSINISINKSNYYNTIFEFWVAKGIKKHRSLNNDIKKAIDKALKEYSVEEIKEAIDNYSTMYHDKEYTWCSYQWGLNEFLLRSDKDRIRQLPMFLNDGSKWTSYLSFKDKNKNTPLNNNKEPIPRQQSKAWYEK